MLFSSSKSALTFHYQQIRYILLSPALRALSNCTPIYPLCPPCPPASDFDSCPPPLQFCPFSTHPARSTLSLASPWDSPKSPKPVVHFLNSFYYQSIIPSIFSFRKYFLRAYYEPGIVLGSEETKINKSFFQSWQDWQSNRIIAAILFTHGLHQV